MKFQTFVMFLVIETGFSYRFDKKRLFHDKEMTAQPLAENSGHSTTTLKFTDDWQELVDGKLAIGEQFKILYDGSRLPGRPRIFNNPAWSLVAKYKFSNDNKVHTTQLLLVGDKDILTATVTMPYTAKKLIIWFKHWGYYSGYTYDSNHSANYHFKITKPSIVFDDHWGETVHGRLESGGMFDAFYDSIRMKENAKIFAEMKFSEKGEVHKQLLSYLGKNTSYQKAVVRIPKDAEKVIMWFYSEENGEMKYDSHFDDNYHFELSRVKKEEVTDLLA